VSVPELPAVSVAMATYKGARHLREQLDSIAAQTELPAELVISDDNSPDDTIAVAEEFARTAPFEVRILPPHERFGFSDNFLHAAEQCRSPLVMFCDQDDVWLPTKLTTSRQRLIADDSHILLHTLTLTDETMQPVGHLSQGIERNAVFEPLDFEPFLCGYGNTMMFRRELLHLVPRTERPPADGRVLSHDTWIYTLAAALGRVTHLADSLILYRRDGGNVSQLDNRSHRQRLVDLATFDQQRHLDHARFDHEMAAVFDRLCERSASWAERASRAAKRYREREQTLRLRLDLFGSRSPVTRWRSFRTLQRERFAIPGGWRGKALPAAKDFALGVFGLGWRR